MPLCESQSSLRVLITASFAATAPKFVERLVEAGVGAVRVHGHCLEASLDRHVIVLKEELELAGEAELVLSTEIVQLGLFLRVELLHLGKFARIFHHSVLDLVKATFENLSVSILVTSKLFKLLIELFILFTPLLLTHREVANK